MRRKLFVLIAFALMSVDVSAEQWWRWWRPKAGTFLSAYWVSPTGAATWTNCQSATPLAGTSACSLTTMRSSSVAAGDTVYFREGAYSYNDAATLISPSTSGTASRRITYAAHAAEVPVITNINAGTTHYEVFLSGDDYITVRGLTFVDFNRHIWIANGSDYNEIDGNTISRTSVVSGGVGRAIQVTGNTTASTHNWIRRNVIHFFDLAACGEGGDGIKIGDTVHESDGDSNYNTIEDNVLYDIGHAATDNFSQFNVYRRNFVHNAGYKTFTANLTGTATGGSTTTLIDITANFTSLGVMTGSFLYVHDLSDPGSGDAKRAEVTSISTTTNPSDTLNYTASGSATPTFAAAHSYSIGCAYFADANPPGDGKYAHRAFHIDTQMTASGVNRTLALEDQILFEKNRACCASSNPANDGADGLSLSAGRVIVRYNDIYGSAGPGLYTKNGIVASDNRIYNNTIYGNGRFSGTQFPSNPITTSGVQVSATATLNKLLNNILYNNGDGDFDFTPPGDWTVSNNHLQANGDPLFTNPDLTAYASLTLPDLSLQVGSAAIDSGTHLTTAAGAGSSSTALTVVDSKFFQDGTWGSSLSDIQPDWIAVGTVGNTVQIASINYSTHVITLATPISWSDGASVWLYKISDGSVVLVGTAPDKGSREKQ